MSPDTERPSGESLEAVKTPESGETWAVAPAGGSGTRFSDSQDKLLADLAGLPVLVRTLRALASVPALAGIVLVASPLRQAVYEELLARHALPMAVRLALGGRDRRESVYNGLLALPETATFVVIHDAARPLIQPETVERALTAVRQGAAGSVVAMPVHDTVKQACPLEKQAHPRPAHRSSLDPRSFEAPLGAENAASPLAVIDRTLDRALLWRAQTPQVFRLDLILAAHRRVPQETPVTDDAQLLELAGLGPVALIPSDEGNLKITTPADLALAEACLRLRDAE